MEITYETADVKSGEQVHRHPAAYGSQQPTQQDGPQIIRHSPLARAALPNFLYGKRGHTETGNKSDERESERTNDNQEPSHGEKDMENKQCEVSPDSSVSRTQSDVGSNRYDFDLIDAVQPDQETSFSTKKTVVQGMMDLALITANANQLRTLLEYGSRTATFELIIGCIVLSLCIQITVGLTLIVFRHKMHPSLQSYKTRPLYIKRIDNLVLAGVFLVTVLNVFIAAFTTIQDRHYNVT